MGYTYIVLLVLCTRAAAQRLAEARKGSLLQDEIICFWCIKKIVADWKRDMRDTVIKEVLKVSCLRCDKDARILMTKTESVKVNNCMWCYKE